MTTLAGSNTHKKLALRILVVENEPVTASVITSVMTGLGWQVDFAASGKAVEKLQKKQQYDVVLLDVTLPDIAGTRVYQQLKQQYGTSLPVLLINAIKSKTTDIQLLPGDDFVPDATDTRDIVSRCQTLAGASAVAVSA